jgi:hypothetical protein
MPLEFSRIEPHIWLSYLHGNVTPSEMNEEQQKHIQQIKDFGEFPYVLIMEFAPDFRVIIDMNTSHLLAKRLDTSFSGLVLVNMPRPFQLVVQTIQHFYPPLHNTHFVSSREQGIQIAQEIANSFGLVS